MMLGSKGILTPLIPDCYVLCTLAIFKNIRNLLIFLRKMATYSYFWRVKRSKILLQASLYRLSDLLTLVSLNAYPINATYSSISFANVSRLLLQKSGFVRSMSAIFAVSSTEQVAVAFNSALYFGTKLSPSFWN